MRSRRQNISSYYGQGLVEATAQHYEFRGAGLFDGVVVRVDLNGYSDWTRYHGISDRVELLSDFFTKVVAYLDKYGGIYFRDEGDCIVSLFSSYFELDPYAQVENFCKEVVSDYYGVDGLTAKAIVAAGEIAIYQKVHEVDTGDWSAEGEPFVRAVRLEQAVESKQHIYYFADEYKNLFSQYTICAAAGEKYCWEFDHKSEQVQGLGLPGGWVELAIEKYIPRGKI